MKINRTVRNILSITAFAWSIPFAQAGEALNTGIERERAARKSPDASVETPDGKVKLTGIVRDDDLAKR